VNGPSTLTNASGKTLTLPFDTINAPLVNQGTLAVTGSSTVAGGLSNVAGALLAVQGNDSFGSVTPTVNPGFTNNGAIDLTNASTSGNGWSADLTVTGGAFINAAGATLTASPGTFGGSRALNAQLVNQGTLTVNQPLTLNPSGASSNSGTLAVSSGQTL